VRWATPLFIALVLIEIRRRDLRGRLGAGDLPITQDPFIVYTSNIFAILGCARSISCWRRWCIASTT
jgi:hypothetical protein